MPVVAQQSRETRNTMAKKRAGPAAPRPSKRHVIVTEEQWEALERIGAEQDRTASYIGRIAVQEFLERRGRAPKKKD
jgi:hypothetical protein